MLLKSCDVAIITATTLLNNTFEEIITCWVRRALWQSWGPSTPLMPAIFRTHTGNSSWAERSSPIPHWSCRLSQRAAELPALRPYLRFGESDFKPISAAFTISIDMDVTSPCRFIVETPIPKAK